MGFYRKKFKKRKVDQLWEAQDIDTALGNAFPHWRGQIWTALRGDGVHALLVPQMFGAEVVEIKAEMDASRDVQQNQQQQIDNLSGLLQTKEKELSNVIEQRSILKKNYDKLYEEYQILDKKYRKEVLRHWFRLTPGTVISAGIGFGVGYIVGK